MDTFTMEQCLYIVLILSGLDYITVSDAGNDIIGQEGIPPLPEFRPMTTVKPLRVTEKLCPDYDSSCRDARPGPNAICFCDAVCAIRDDCCRHYRPYRRVDHLSRQRVLAYMQCAGPNPHGLHPDLTMLRRCPHDYESNMVRAQCEQPDISDRMLTWPVSGKYNGLLYRNIYCAMCWGERNPLFWIMKTHCQASVKALPGATPDPNPDFKQFLKACPYKFSTPFYEGANERLCGLVYISNCPRRASDADTKGCAHGGTEIVVAFNAVLNDNVRYKNADCALCNGVSKPDIFCLPGVVYGQVESNFAADRMGMSTLFDVNSKTIRSEGRWTSGFENMNMTCMKGQIFDLFTRECRKLVCAENEIYHARKCHPDNSTLMPDCATVLVPASDLVRTENGSVHIKGTDTYLNASQYHNFNDSIIICADAIIYNDVSLYKLTGFVTSLGYSISCVSLVILLVVYSLIPKLRNVPGKLTMGLSSSLLTAQLLFLVGIDRNELVEICAAFAVLLHYFYLSAFAWMFLLSLDLTLTFRPGNTRNRARTKSRAFCKYALYAYLMPAAIVLLGITLDLIPSTAPYNPGYGIRQCWFSHRLPLLLLFLLPVSLHIISNILMFLYTAYNVCMATRAVQMVRPVDECRVFLYLKLSVIMGATWVLVYAWLLTHETVLEILFVVFNSLQGLFICLCFVCRPKTFALLNSRLTGREVSKDTTPSTKRTSSLSAGEKSSSLLRGRHKKGKQDLWIEMPGDPASIPLKQDSATSAI